MEAASLAGQPYGNVCVCASIKELCGGDLVALRKLHPPQQHILGTGLCQHIVQLLRLLPVPQ